MTAQQTFLDSAAKDALRKSVRRLRGLLLEQLYEAVRGEYRLDSDADKAKLPEVRRCRRQHLDDWLDERERALPNKKGLKPLELRRRALDQAVKEAAHTWLNRLVFLRILEHHGLSQPAVLTGGWKSPGYANEFARYAGPLAQDDSLGMLPLLKIIFAELALELPGLFGPVGLTELFPMPAAALRETIEALNDSALDSAWGDDTTLGWVYQYWNDPEREALDAKIAGGGKIEPHEIASKTQMFTERYMVEWLLQNSLGLTWLCMCKKRGWQAEAEPVLATLDARRAAFRQRREAGEVPADALMPIETGIENAWKYYVPQPLPADAIEKAPPSIRELKLLDPACGSGHFLVIAFDLLALLYREEALHRGETWSDQDIAQSIIENNLHGIDIDARAIQIAAAGLWLKARLFAPAARLSQLNLVAPTLELGNLPADDPALVQLRKDLKREVNLPEELTQKLVSALGGVSHLGSLLRVDAAIEAALKETDAAIEQGIAGQGDLFRGYPKQQLSLPDAKATVLDQLERFLGQHSSSQDLGLRLDGEQLAAGVRFVRLAKEGTYDIVVGNPPYQGLSKTAQFEYVTKNYPRGKADLYAAFLERGLELVRDGGSSALVTMRGWMFLGQFAELRARLLKEHDLRSLVDLDSGAFDEVSAAQVVLSVACSVFRRCPPDAGAVAIRPTPTDDRASTGMTNRKRAGLLAQVGRYEFDPKGFEVIEGEPIVYWWTSAAMQRYQAAAKLGDVAKIREGVGTKNDPRYLRSPWEVGAATIMRATFPCCGWSGEKWVPFVKGAVGRRWCDSVSDVVNWHGAGLEIATYAKSRFGRGASSYFSRGIAFTMIGADFGARLHRTPSIFGHMGGSAFPDDLAAVLCSVNSEYAQRVATSLNPTLHFLVGDVARLPIADIDGAKGIVEHIEEAFTTHESVREPSVEFKSPGPSPHRR